MDATIAAEQPTGGFINWITQYGSLVAFFAQLLYWLVIAVLLFYAVWQFKRWVNFQLGVGRSGKLRLGETESPATDERVAAQKAADKGAAEKVSVEEFVD